MLAAVVLNGGDVSCSGDKGAMLAAVVSNGGDASCSGVAVVTKVRY